MISIIVPVYNIEKYLVPCVDSILGSSCQDFELILVDDGATDSSGSICDEYSSRDERITVLHQENGGIGVARNNGFKKAKGEYVIFIDGDDVIHPEMLEMMKNALDSSDSDLALVRAYTIDDNGEVTSTAMEREPVSHTITQEEYMRCLFGKNEFGYPVVWNKLYRRTLIEDLPFKTVDAEDIEWMTRVLMKVKKISVIERQLYGYRLRPTSITRQANGLNMNIVNRLETYLMCLNEIPREYRNYRSWCLLYTYKYLLSTRHLFRGSSLYGQAKEKITKVYKQTVDEMLHSDLSLPVKLALYGFYHLPGLYAPLYSIHAKRCASRFEQEGFKQS